MNFRFVAFLSDYGLDDEFVGVCRGVIKRIAPDVEVLDVAHGIAPRDVAGGAMVLARAVAYLPDAVYLGVVDPGVGTDRRALVIETAAGHPLVGPDNGLLLPAAEMLGGAVHAYAIERRELTLDPVSATFHGRDVFAPVAARLALGLAPDEAGPEVAVRELVRLEVSPVDVSVGRIRARVLGVDRFGNLQLNASESDLAAAGFHPGDSMRVRVDAGERAARYSRTFADVPPGELAAVVDAAGLAAVVVNRGSAATALDAERGDAVTLARPE